MSYSVLALEMYGLSSQGAMLTSFYRCLTTRREDNQRPTEWRELQNRSNFEPTLVLASTCKQQECDCRFEIQHHP
jgi:hypothetical protein